MARLRRTRSRMFWAMRQLTSFALLVIAVSSCDPVTTEAGTDAGLGDAGAHDADSGVADAGCTNPPPEVVTNTCVEVGYPAGTPGAYVSARQFDCATQTYGAWMRTNTCVRADAGVDAGCTNPPPEVVTNTCVEVGYPAGTTGAYVSARQFNCATQTYGAWMRTNTCVRADGGVDAGCTNPPPEVVTNTCVEVGYPAGTTGAYVSARQFNCTTQSYGPWLRTDTCVRPDAGCTNPPPEVVTNTCVEVGYPAGTPGAYVSARQFNCVTQTYGPWTRTNTCVPVFQFTAPNNSIDLREYFPPTTTFIRTARSDGSTYGRYTFSPDAAVVLPNTTLTSQALYMQYFNLNKPGRVYTWNKSYGLEDAGTPTIAHFFLGDDLSVTEAGDWFAPDNVHPSVAFGYATPAGTAPDGLAWSAPGGLRTPSSSAASPVHAERYAIGVSRQSTAGTPYSASGATAWNKTLVLETLPAYTPAFGRGADGGWGFGNGKTYFNVVRLAFFHGTHVAPHTDFTCDAGITNPKYAGLYVNLPGYHSYASEFYLARNQGLIQETLLYIEDGTYWGAGRCPSGILFSADQSASNANISYRDER